MTISNSMLLKITALNYRRYPNMTSLLYQLLKIIIFFNNQIVLMICVNEKHMLRYLKRNDYDLKREVEIKWQKNLKLLKKKRENELSCSIF
jgi:hypothetical protein